MAIKGLYIGLILHTQQENRSGQTTIIVLVSNGFQTPRRQKNGFGVQKGRPSQKPGTTLNWACLKKSWNGKMGFGVLFGFPLASNKTTAPQTERARAAPPSNPEPHLSRPARLVKQDPVMQLGRGRTGGGGATSAEGTWKHRKPLRT